MDGPICNWQKAASRYLNHTYGYNLLEEHPTWDYVKDNVAPEHWKGLWVEGTRWNRLYANLELTPGSLQAVERLASKHDVYLITSRPMDARKQTIEWVAKELPLDLAGIHIVGPRADKSQVRCDVYLDDRPENVQAIRTAFPGSVTVLWRMPHNRPFLWWPAVDNWEQFEAIVNDVNKYGSATVAGITSGMRA